MPANPQYTPGVGVLLSTGHIPLRADDVANDAAQDVAIAGKVLRISGTKAARPTLTAASAGYMYFATNEGANGTPLWWNGTAWVTAASVIVA